MIKVLISINGKSPGDIVPEVDPWDTWAREKHISQKSLICEYVKEVVKDPPKKKEANNAKK